MTRTIENNTLSGCGAGATQSDIFVAACAPVYDPETGLPTKNGNPITVGQPFAMGRIAGNRFVQVEEPHHAVELYGFDGLVVEGNTIEQPKPVPASLRASSAAQGRAKKSGLCEDVCGSFDRFDVSEDGATLGGWVVDIKLAKPNISSYVSFEVDGVVVGGALANGLRPDLVGPICKEPQHGFTNKLPAAVAKKLLVGNHTLAVVARRQDGSMFKLNKKLYCVNHERRTCAFPSDCTCGAPLPSRMLISNSIGCSARANTCDGQPCSATTPVGGCKTDDVLRMSSDARTTIATAGGRAPAPAPSVSALPIEPDEHTSSSLPSLKRLMPKRMHIGAAMHYDSVQASKHADAAQYAALQQAQFGMSQDKNCMNWAFVEYKARGVFRWGPTDSFVDWCNKTSTLVRGHALVWGAHLPAWLLAMAPPNGTAANASTVAAIRHAVKESVAAMVGRYRGRVYAWHAVMEAFGDPHWKQPVWKDNLLYRTFGAEYVGIVFEFARAADPAAKLCLLDYQISWGMYAGGVWDHAKADSFFGIVSGFKNSSWGSKLDCVCMETHLQPTAAANRTAYTWLRRNFDRYAPIGVEVHLNALTISINGFDAAWSNENKLEAQATWYQVFLEACVDSPACVDFEPYGLTDKYDMGTEPIHSLPFDAKYDPKPAFWAMVGVLNGSGTITPRGRLTHDDAIVPDGGENRIGVKIEEALEIRGAP